MYENWSIPCSHQNTQGMNAQWQTRCSFGTTYADNWIICRVCVCVLHGLSLYLCGSVRTKTQKLEFSFKKALHAPQHTKYARTQAYKCLQTNTNSLFMLCWRVLLNVDIKARFITITSVSMLYHWIGNRTRNPCVHHPQFHAIQFLLYREPNKLAKNLSACYITSHHERCCWNDSWKATVRFLFFFEYCMLQVIFLDCSRKTWILTKFLSTNFSRINFNVNKWSTFHVWLFQIKFKRKQQTE